MNVVSKVSRIGKLPIVVPDKVKVTLEGNAVSVKVGHASDTSRALPLCSLFALKYVVHQQCGSLMHNVRRRGKHPSCGHGDRLLSATSPA